MQALSWWHYYQTLVPTVQLRLLLPFILSFLAIPAGYAAESSVSNVSLQQLSFLVGRWRENRAGTRLEECWLEPEAGAMVGLSRFTTSEQVKLYELLSLQQEQRGPVLRLRHFSPQLAAWKSESGAVTCPLTSFKDGEAMFESRENDSLLRITYRTTNADALDVVVEKSKVGSNAISEFHFTRMK